MTSKKNLDDAFGGGVKSTPLKEALKDKKVEEWTPDQVKLSELGIPLIATKTLTLGWHSLHDGKKKVFHPNNKSLENITKGFWTYAMNTIHPLDLLKIDTDLLEEDFAEITLKQIMNKGGSISDNLEEENEILRNQLSLLRKDDNPQKRIKELLDLVEELQNENAILEGYKRDLQDAADIDKSGLLKWLYEFMSEKMIFNEFIFVCYNCEISYDFNQLKWCKSATQKGVSGTIIHYGLNCPKCQLPLYYIHKKEYKDKPFVSKESIAKLTKIEEVIK